MRRFLSHHYDQKLSPLVQRAHNSDRDMNKYNSQMIIQRPVALHNVNLSYNIYILLYCIYMFLAYRRIE